MQQRLANSAAYLVAAKPPPGWQGVDTNFAQLASGGTDDAGQVLASMRRVKWVQAFAQTVPPHSVRVLPETVLGSFDGVSRFSLAETQAALAARGSRLLVGAELPQPNGQFQNGVLVLGAKDGEAAAAVQNIPVPISMWNPWLANGAVADVFGRGNLVEVNGVRAGVIVCYEQVLAYSLLWLLSGHPDVIVAVSNVWWARTTSIPVIQQQMVDSFGRLFGVGVVLARNF